jgi:DNA-directed RNA polymerase specialized sigma24 family protein
MRRALKTFRIAARPPAGEALETGLVTMTDLLRLKALARFHARGLPPDVGWPDLLQEAFARVLDGTRRRPEGIPIVAFVAGVMRSLRADHWRRARREARSSIDVDAHADADTLSPERRAMAQQELDDIVELFANDAAARGVIVALAEGLSPPEICAELSLTRIEYDSIRKRMRRTLLREGLRTKLP